MQSFLTVPIGVIFFGREQLAQKFKFVVRTLVLTVRDFTIYKFYVLLMYEKVESTAGGRNKMAAWIRDAIAAKLQEVSDGK
jgi:hypothetical protein